MKISVFPPLLITFLLPLVALPIFAQAADALDKSRDTVSKTNQQLQQKQQTINKLHEQTGQLVDQYREALRESETYRVYNRQLKEIVRSQASDLSSLQTQIIDIEVTAQQIMPMMQRMIDALEQFIAQDIPFLPVERAGRLEKLKNTMKRADITVAEKYRKILEAYQIEIEYGKTLEAYQAQLSQADGNKMVSFLKVGRVAFYYKTLDGNNYAAWDTNHKKWHDITDHEVRKSVTLGLKIARKQHAPELLTIVVSAAQEMK